MNRRNLIKGTLAGAATLGLGQSPLWASQKAQIKPKHNFTFCLNTSTIRQQNLKFDEEIKLAAKVGFDGIEIWINKMQAYAEAGGSLADIKKMASDEGIVIEDAIGFAPWIVDNDEARAKGLEQMKREMDMLAQIGCKRVAAPPIGATTGDLIDLEVVAKRFRKVCDLGQEMGVLPQLELWGFSKNMHLFGQTLFVAAECGHPDAVILPDVYHLKRGGSPFEALEMINGSKIQMFHMNDFPKMDDYSTMTDAMRVLPGDGVAPYKEILGILNRKNVPIALSLEIFNKDVWAMDAQKACELGLKKMKSAVEKAVA
ncbi:sugar phosphate isomerase/epimerase [Marinilongibacter aquaticus]|uniref:sugar phosphate isomerase/epimerase family protein n=1 Tax=Marinilongibacter aquaticus TaxID=2975157 RepID=UPI0021BD05E3|nr:sugar phosphate isomerase/epimerase family protein [Marinilongibacter aquaticus]UBM60568.1 sugar phosphate isomerase/epimerase [Marinilongibacter aquaticus]